MVRPTTIPPMNSAQDKPTQNEPKRAPRNPAPRHAKPLIGWREYVRLPDLGGIELVAKIDTGARTSSLHADRIEYFISHDGVASIRITLHSKTSDGHNRTTTCELPSADVRTVKSSDGFAQSRHVIRTRLAIGEFESLVEITLADRKSMRYPMLLGRTTLRSRFLIDPGKSFLLNPRPSTVGAPSPRSGGD